MYATQSHYRALYETLLDRPDARAFGDLLRPWLDGHEEERRFLHSFAARAGSPWPAAEREELCHLYAASRVNELLLLRFQPLTYSSSSYHGPRLELDEYVQFMLALGFRVESPARFNPFFHEIVGVERSPASQKQIVLVSEHWPALMLGDLLFSRAGCSVRAPATEIDPEIATRSTLYWAHWRKNRPTDDLGKGWGSNSRWRTAFRRDYHSGGMFHFNVDGKIDATDPDRRKAGVAVHSDDLSVAERIELVTHRCFVRTSRCDSDRWPFDDRYSIPADA